MPSSEPIIQLRGVSKGYRGLRPLRIQQLDIAPGQSVALLGFDLEMAEVLVDLITGTTLPDTGEVRVLGQATSDIDEPDAWLATLDRFGLLSERAVLVEQFTAEENLTIPLSLSLDDVPDALRERVRRQAAEVGLTADELSTPVSRLAPLQRVRIHLGRALAPGPRVLLAEHPTAPLPAPDAAALAAAIARIVTDRRLAALLITADVAFARAAAHEVLSLQPATGALKRLSGWRRWFRQP